MLICATVIWTGRRPIWPPKSNVVGQQSFLVDLAWRQNLSIPQFYPCALRFDGRLCIFAASGVSSL